MSVLNLKNFVKNSKCNEKIFSFFEFLFFLNFSQNIFIENRHCHIKIISVLGICVGLGILYIKIPVAYFKN